VPNVAAAIVCASDAPASWPLTTWAGRSSTRMSSSALTHACAATKCATATRQRPGNASAATSAAPAIATTAHRPKSSPFGAATTVIALSASNPASTSIAVRAVRALGVTTSSAAPHSGVPM